MCTESDDINTILKLQEEKEYWEDKLLELKLKSIKNNFSTKKQNTNLTSELTENEAELISLQEAISDLRQKIHQTEKAKTEKERKLNSIDNQIKKAKNESKELTEQINSLSNYYMNINLPENIVQHILTMKDDFKQKIYNECTRRVNDALQFSTFMQQGKNDKNYQNPYAYQMRTPFMAYPVYSPMQFSQNNK